MSPEAPLTVLALDVDAPLLAACRAPAFDVARRDEGAEIIDALAAGAGGRHDAIVIGCPTHDRLAALRDRPGLAQLASASALVVLSAADDEALEAELLQRGVEAIIDAGPPQAVARALRHAVLRHRAQRSARTAYATDLATGLPHEAQLLEHMTQLLALREREPAPMVLIALRVQGYAQAAARAGSEGANVLRRKVAVRLRSGLRASDVVASIGPETFAVLLGHLEAAADGERVAAKLARALKQPMVVAGNPCRVGVSIGLAIYPEHGKQAVVLLQRALAQAGNFAATDVAAPAAEPARRLGSEAANDESD